MSYSTITSRQNVLFKYILSLEKAKERKAEQSFIIEGIKEIELAIAGNYIIDQIYYPEDIKGDYLNDSKYNGIEKIAFSRSLFNDICYRKDIDNLIAIAKMKSHDINEISLPKNPLIVVLEAIEKPGNIGAILRTADAVGVDLIILCEMTTDLYNPNVVRNSLGCLFTNKIAVMSSLDAKDFLIKEKINIFTTYLHTENAHFSCNYKEKTAFVFGAEATGISETWLSNEVTKIKIPMRGKIDSMNVSNSVAVLLYEALRQRL